MRGGVDADNLMYNSDMEDLEIISKVVSENIEAAKKTGQPII